MKKIPLFIIVALMLAATSVAYAHQGVRRFKVNLQPLNDSGVSGQAWLILRDGQLTVSIEATGLEANKLHPQHIHGFDQPANSTCPTLAADADGDGLISVGEGLPDYGPVLLPLMPFSTAPDGTISYQATFDDLSVLEPINTLQNRAIVLHGLTVNDDYEPTLPVACGQIQPASARR